jgi:hypothetical protein
MMQKHAQPMSPRTQAFAQGAPSGDEETKLFEEGLSQMAYNVLVSKFPDLIQDVVTFKILDTDIENGAGAGAFVVQHENETLYIPVVMADNQIKPLDMFYHKGLNVFLPLNNDWLNEVSQLTLDETGEAIDAPKSLRRNIDTRNIMIPPTTGRYAYAAARNEPLTEEVIAADIYRMLERMTKEAAEQTSPVLLRFLSFAPDTIKEAFYNVLKSRPKLAANVALMYGLDNIAGALETTKTASATSPKGGALFVADKDTPATKFKEVFGDKAPEAYQGVLLKGYTAQDNRENTDSAVQIQGEEKLKTPSDTGFYRIFTSDGKEQNAFILHNPRSVTKSFNEGPERRNGKRKDTLGFGQHNKDFIVVTRGGAWRRTSKMVAAPLEEQKDGPTAIFNAVSNEQGGQQPRVGDRGMFVVQKGQTWVGTEPFRIKSIASSNGTKRITLQDWENTVLVMDKNAAKMGLHQPKNEPVVFIPPSARYIRLKDEPMTNGELLSTPSEVNRWFKDKFDAMGANSASVKNAGAGQFSLDGTQDRYDMVGAMKAAALKYNIPFTEAEALVKEAAGRPNGRAVAYILSPSMLTKMAQVPMMGDPAAAGGAPPPGGAPMDPSMMDPSMQGGAPPPAPPSPLDIAMGEAQTQIQQQMSDLQQQSMALQDKAQTLMMVQQRAQEVATGGQEAVQQGAAPMPPPGMGAPQGAPPPGGAPPQGGAMPAPAPEAMGGGGMAAAGMSPGMEGGMPPTGAAMTTESPSAMEIQQQVNPQFLESAAGLADTGAFDAAAIASMAQAPSFRDMVVDYVPTLERALDNLGRVLLTMWMQEAELKEQLGDEDYSDTEDNIRVVFEGLGKLILQMNRNAIVVDENVAPGV